MPEKKPGTGVLVMRCQGQRFKKGWRHIVSHALARHERVLVVVGMTGGWPTRDNPLTFEMVSQMITQAFPTSSRISCIKLNDSPLSQDAWSEDLDTLINTQCGQGLVKLYYSRDGFGEHYSGKYKGQLVYVPPINDLSGTEMRHATAFPHSEDARAAIIHYHQTREPFSYPSVDTAIIDSKRKRGVLIRQRKFRMMPAFCGGMFDPTKDESYEDTSRRETSEELPTIEAGPPIYIGSAKIDDPRYRKSQDRIVSALFYREYLGGDPAGGDDADDAGWYDLAELPHVVVLHHRPLAARLSVYLAHVGIIKPVMA